MLRRVQPGDGPPRINSLHFALRALIGNWPTLFFMLNRAVGGKRGYGLVQKNTNLVIEGFPRSANSFACQAFLQNNADMTVASHTHVPAQVMRAVKLKVPVLVIVRDPISVVQANRVGYPNLSNGLLLWAYTRFHEKIFAYREHLVIATFDEVTNDFAEVLQKVNQRFGTSFRSGMDNDQARARAFDEMTKKGAAEEHLALPNATRSRKAKTIKVDSAWGYLGRAQRVHDKLHKEAICTPGACSQ